MDRLGRGSGSSGRSSEPAAARSRPTSVPAVTPTILADRAGGDVRPADYIARMTPARVIRARYRQWLPGPTRPHPPRP
ncbi:hypothetical protein Pa4123_44550 [Phytohabitans aurantiacus]|uniref:Uncharacterized protein n=1 Tax=Phytohabitans aurantiacus TaxID=3016789 RepID=A0ABQ5R0S1_9ACTN|nr:hypothetical protein Pa4123_44550 [Phytohabitans aurantiacus]